MQERCLFLGTTGDDAVIWMAMPVSFPMAVHASFFSPTSRPRLQTKIQDLVKVSAPTGGCRSHPPRWCRFVSLSHLLVAKGIKRRPQLIF